MSTAHFQMHIVACNELVCPSYKKKCFDDRDFADMTVSLDRKTAGLGTSGSEVSVSEHLLFVDEGRLP